MKSYEELKAMSEKELEEFLSNKIDGFGQSAAPEVIVKKILILQQARQNQLLTQQNKSMVKFTKWIVVMTGLMLLFTIANAIILLMSLNII